MHTLTRSLWVPQAPALTMHTLTHATHTCTRSHLHTCIPYTYISSHMDTLTMHTFTYATHHAHPHTCTPHTCTPSHMHTLTHVHLTHVHLTHAHPHTCNPHICIPSHMHTLTHAHPHTGTTLRLLPPKLVVTEGETVTFTCTPVSPYAYPLLTMNNALVITHPRLKVSKKQYQVEYRIAGNFHKPQTNMPGKNFMIFIFMYGLTTTWTNPRSYSPSHYWYTMIRMNISIATYVHNPRPSIK